MFAHVGSAPVEEALLVLAPVSLLIGALLLANRRANRIAAGRAQAANPDGPDGPDSPTDADVDAGAPTGPPSA